MTLSAITGRLAVGVDERAKPSKQSEKGRVCANPRCETVLSIYNPEPTCSVHVERKTPRIR